MNTIPSITLLLVERDTATAIINYECGDYAGALAAARQLVSNAEALVMFLELLTQPKVITRQPDAQGMVTVNGARYHADCPDRTVEITVSPAGPADPAGRLLMPVSLPDAVAHHD